MMERLLTETYTKSSTSGSLSNISDLSVEEHLDFSAHDSISLDSVISYLSKSYTFFYFNSKGLNLSSSVFFTDSLNILHIATDKNKTKKIFTSDIIDISAGNSIQVNRDSELIYLVTVKSRNKTVILGSKSLQERDYWNSCAGVLLKYAKECFSSVGLRKFCDSVVHNKENESEIIRLRDAQYYEWLRIKSAEQEIQIYEKEAVRCLVNEMISEIDLRNQKQSIEQLERKVLNLIGDKFLHKQSQGNLVKALRQKDYKIQLLTDRCTRVRNHLFTIHSYLSHACPWKSIISSHSETCSY